MVETLELQDQEEPPVYLLVPLVSMVITGLIGYLFYFWWLVRASRNLESLGSKGRRYQPVLLILTILLRSIALPALFKDEPSLLAIILLVAEYLLSLLTLQEIWKGSNPAFTYQGEAWKKSKGSFLIFSWWASSIVAPLFFLLPLAAPSLDLKVPQLWFFIWIGVMGVYVLLSALVILRINFRQWQKYSALARK